MTSSYYPIHEKPGFEADAYAEKIERALRNGEKDTVAKLIVDINNAQRQKVKEPYRIRYGKELLQALDKKFSGDAETLILALMMSPLEYDLEQLEKAMKGLGTDEAVLIEIICSRTPDQLKAIAAHYDKKHEKAPLAKTVAGDTSGEFKDLLVALVTGSKDNGQATNDAQAHDDAVRLFADGKGKFKGADGSHFLHILATQNMYQLRKVFAEFEKLSGQNIENAIEKEFSGDLRAAYLTIVRASVNKQKFFATQLHNSMKGLGTRENDLIRAVVARSEVDLNLIKEEYKQLYGKPLEDHIKGDTSGVFRDTLLNICAGNL
ncbi:hypothetical protein PENTCL1PPCAC_13365 [Pristionchus entomophagus]|uniref:Annexin n=1 Tax=Pristionchus entomophagus TaxID=358040 RepID=A0AAV5T6N8_9BILA|nr:hypothetical protein PENTCL1PPCAC_13365 [Pristionchus entomophagus]